MNFAQKGVHIKKKGRVYIMKFLDKGKVDTMDFWE